MKYNQILDKLNVVQNALYKSLIEQPKKIKKYGKWRTYADNVLTQADAFSN